MLSKLLPFGPTEKRFAGEMKQHFMALTNALESHIREALTSNKEASPYDPQAFFVFNVRIAEEFWVHLVSEEMKHLQKRDPAHLNKILKEEFGYAADDPVTTLQINLKLQHDSSTSIEYYTAFERNPGYLALRKKLNNHGINHDLFLVPVKDSNDFCIGILLETANNQPLLNALRDKPAVNKLQARHG